MRECCAQGGTAQGGGFGIMGAKSAKRKAKNNSAKVKTPITKTQKSNVKIQMTNQCQMTQCQRLFCHLNFELDLAFVL